MKIIILMALVLIGSNAFAETKCLSEANTAAEALMKLNGESYVGTNVVLVKKVTDGVNTDHTVFDVTGFAEYQYTTLTYRMTVDNLWCKVIKFEYLGAN